MNFKYSIQYQNKQARTITVLYEHESPKTLAVCYVLSYPEGATDETLRNVALAAAPVEQWQEAIDREEPDFELGTFDATFDQVAEVVASNEPAAPTFDELKERKRREIDEWRVMAEQRGMPWTFGDIKDRVQVRNERDLTNINGQVSAALVLKGRGVTDPVLPFRAQSNITHNMTPDEMIEMGLAVGEFTANQYMKAWALKAELDLAETVEELEAIVWPADS